MKQLSFINKDGSIPNKYRFVNIPDDDYDELLARSNLDQDEMATVTVGCANVVFNVNEITETPYGITIIVDHVNFGRM